ncbi:hypothetical protein AZK19_01615 [Streptococcus pneumoniae]|uniref:Uncharacterized protein n=1 Tax=Streptococcus pneumoniae TaxID=1313 RepID=A0A558R946_STREE|nr:hypothetical protein BUM80_09440 [Streptococcus pneumoniae]AXJ87534.1 hypothetical protein C1H54_00415 [Streptococcus pneumoniae]MDA5253185.1 hypothetical protein [Streptococcus pneumoniae]MDA5264974.1 hypothetical protein [Streptococcus pneumoniae]MTV57681.1 hypothetical protein [Streptococcus pneumoniae]
MFWSGGNFETLGSKFRNETEGLLPPPSPKTIIKKKNKNSQNTLMVVWFASVSEQI